MNRQIDSAPVIEATGRILKEHFAETQRELARTDRAFNLIATVEGLHIKESVDGLRQWVQSIGYEKSHLREARALAPPWLAGLDSKGSAK